MAQYSCLAQTASEHQQQQHRQQYIQQFRRQHQHQHWRRGSESATRTAANCHITTVAEAKWAMCMDARGMNARSQGAMECTVQRGACWLVYIRTYSIHTCMRTPPPPPTQGVPAPAEQRDPQTQQARALSSTDHHRRSPGGALPRQVAVAPPQLWRHCHALHQQRLAAARLKAVVPAAAGRQVRGRQGGHVGAAGSCV